MQFVQYNGNSSSYEVRFRCPCINGLNGRKFVANKVKEHILCDEFLRSYTTWK